MRRVLYFAVAIIGIAVVATSCSSTYDANPSDPGTRNPLLGDFRANISGGEFIAEQKFLHDTTINGTRMLTFTGVVYGPEKDTAAFSTVSITISGYDKLGTYPFDGYTTGIYAVKSGGFQAHYVLYTGDTTSVVNFTQGGNPDWIGTFNFRAVRMDDGQPHDTVTITNGYFDIPK